MSIFFMYLGFLEFKEMILMLYFFSYWEVVDIRSRLGVLE